MINQPKSFKDYEIRERKLSKSLFHLIDIPDDKVDLESIGSYSKSDGQFEYAGMNRFEVKVRNFSKDKYFDHFIEAPKAVELLKYHKEGYRTYMIMFFKEVDTTYSCIMYNMSNRFKSWAGYKFVEIGYYKNLPSFTAGGGSRMYENKLVLPLIRNTIEFGDIIIDEVPIYEGYVSDVSQTPKSEEFINKADNPFNANTSTNE